VSEMLRVLVAVCSPFRKSPLTHCALTNVLSTDGLVDENFAPGFTVSGIDGDTA
jgi:hypothetical protein